MSGHDVLSVVGWRSPVQPLSFGILTGMRGTLLNTATVAGGASIGLVIGQVIPSSFRDVALNGLGLVVLGIGVRMVLQGKNPLISAISVAAGGVIGLSLGFHSRIEALGNWGQAQFAAGAGAGSFAQGLLTSFVLFCIGPMTLLGCLEDGVEGKIDILSLKSTLDGVAALFLAATFGLGVLASAPLVLLFQGALTLAARPLSPLAKHPNAIGEISGTGGCIMLATGLGLMGIKDFHTANYLPAVFIAPGIALLTDAINQRKVVSS